MICSKSDNMLYILRHLAVRFGRKSELSSPFYTFKKNYFEHFIKRKSAVRIKYNSQNSVNPYPHDLET